MKNHRRKVSIGLILFFSLIVSILITAFWRMGEHRQKHLLTHSAMETEAFEMQYRVDEALTQVYALQALVLGANGGDIDLAKNSQFIMQDKYAPFVRNILLAPDGIVEQVYPIMGNHEVLGLDLYSDANSTQKEALTAKEQGGLVVTGPYELVQGGMAISGRLAVDLLQENGGYKPWGIVSVTLDFPDVISSEGKDILVEQGYAYRLKKVRDNGEVLEVLNQKFDPEMKDYESYTFNIKSMQFVLDAYPAAGWFLVSQEVVSYIFIFALCVCIGLLIRFIFTRLSNLQMGAAKDHLTHMSNRATGVKAIELALKKKKYVKGALVVLDIDNFKSVNDKLGHQYGDKVLVESASIFKQVFHNQDISCRIGGDEFLFFCSLDLEALENFETKMESLRQSMNRHIQKEDDLTKSVQISASIGVCYTPDYGTDFQALYEKADMALYQSKEKGKDCFTIYSE